MILKGHALNNCQDNALVGLHLETEGSGERGQKACSTIMVRQSTLVEF